ncbi:MAG TPA: ArgE/DapE family deacylase [Candidatus Anoxymicrobiaceae bacterium]
MDHRDAFAHVEKASDRLAQMLAELIRIDTSVPPGDNYPAFVDHVEPLLRSAGMETERVVVPEERWRRIGLPLEGERVNLAGRHGSGKPPLTIYAHMDVVPAGPGWTADPFAGIIRDGIVTGRGAIDMKGCIPPVIVACETIKEMGLEPAWDITFLLCTDEEIGIDPGALYLAEQGYFKPPVLHLEGGGQGPMMAGANAGSLKAAITVTGRSIHVGLGFLGINALEQSIPVMEELMRLKADVEKRESKYVSYPIPGIPSPWLTPTFNQTVMRAGDKLNVVPGRAEILLDRRFVPGEDLEEVKGEIRHAVEAARRRSKAEIDVEFTLIYQTHEMDTSSEAVRRWCDITREVLGLEPDAEFFFPGSTGATDMSFVGKVLGTREFIGTGVMDAEHIGAHQPDESVPVVNLVHLCQELVAFLTD